MSDPGVIILLLAMAALAWLWFDSLKVRETAIHAVKAACNVEGLMLLDETVAIRGLKLSRDEDGHIKLQRSYDFEFSNTGNNRSKGSVVLLGNRIVIINVGSFLSPSVTTLH